MNRNWIQSVRWTARLWSIASCGFILLFFIGEGFNPAVVSAREWLGFLFFPFGISVGMILAWWWERTGGIVTAGSLLIFYGIEAATSGRFPRGWAFLTFAAPGFLFLLSSAFSIQSRINNGTVFQIRANLPRKEGIDKKQ